MSEELSALLSEKEQAVLRDFGHALEADGNEVHLARRVLELPDTGSDNWYIASAITLAAAYLAQRSEAKSYASIRAGEDELVGRLRKDAHWMDNNGGVFVDDCADLLRQAADTISALRADLKRMEEALEKISKGEGEYSTVPLIHATNAIESMKAIAISALRASASVEECPPQANSEVGT